MGRTWQFLLPGSGEHIFKVEKIGTLKQTVQLDGVELESREGQTVFSGPDGALLRLKNSGATEQQGLWTLLVDERPVEEAGKCGDGLRDLRSMAEGSYTIATGFSARGIIARKHICRKFRFRIAGMLHSVIVANQDRTWKVAVDGELVDQEKYSILDSAVEVEFTMAAPDSTVLQARLEISWKMALLSWTHRLHIGGIRIPMCYSRARGFLRTVKPPEVLPGWLTVSSDLPVDSATAGELEEEEDGEEENEVSSEVLDQCRESVALDSLPQGVSYDYESDSFQANIRDSKTGRFIFLGEFATPERAHKAYLEALPRYNPEKAIAPSIS
eukprot:gnl/MRDRNA2_/MRDRNA2_93479_c1_seq1.p1 gnl/MRDRNA2_/MRDRNA2_93479_c1~~gnl/MRDRNA2_/MRDRNA2_93479_c1_seq1.p1  ORF type:complete len:328 (-),score=70.42 gnl/MRDRNA2_/MRDRNA2_93479_c1_seq1:207-1190(-)